MFCNSRESIFKVVLPGAHFVDNQAKYRNHHTYFTFTCFKSPTTCLPQKLIENHFFFFVSIITRIMIIIQQSIYYNNVIYKYEISRKTIICEHLFCLLGIILLHHSKLLLHQVRTYSNCDAPHFDDITSNPKTSMKIMYIIIHRKSKVMCHNMFAPVFNYCFVYFVFCFLFDLKLSVFTFLQSRAVNENSFYFIL